MYGGTRRMTDIGGPQSGGGGTPRPRLASTRSSADVLVPDPPVDRRRARWGFFVAFERAAWAGPVLSASVRDPRTTPQENEGPRSREEPRPSVLPEPGFRGVSGGEVLLLLPLLELGRRHRVGLAGLGGLAGELPRRDERGGLGVLPARRVRGPVGERDLRGRGRGAALLRVLGVLLHVVREELTRRLLLIGLADRLELFGGPLARDMRAQVGLHVTPELRLDVLGRDRLELAVDLRVLLALLDLRGPLVSLRGALVREPGDLLVAVDLGEVGEPALLGIREEVDAALLVRLDDLVVVRAEQRLERRLAGALHPRHERLRGEDDLLARL